ncbi:Os05g0515900, partial [Oryza sativa Japonica Group]
VYKFDSFLCLYDYLTNFALVQIGRTSDLSRREREELEKQKSHERHMKLQEQGKTEQARKDLERLTLIRQQRAEAAKKREEEKAAKDERKAEARK